MAYLRTYRTLQRREGIELLLGSKRGSIDRDLQRGRSGGVEPPLELRSGPARVGPGFFSEEVKELRKVSRWTEEVEQ